MNQGGGHRSTPLQEIPEADANVKPVADDRPGAIVSKAGIEEALQPTQQFYRAISTLRSASRLCSTIIANCFCSGAICLPLGFLNN